MPYHVNILTIIDNLNNALQKEDINKILKKNIHELSLDKTTISPTREIYNIYPEYFRNYFLDATIEELTNAMVEYKKKWKYTQLDWTRIAQGYVI